MVKSIKLVACQATYKLFKSSKVAVRQVAYIILHQLIKNPKSSTETLAYAAKGNSYDGTVYFQSSLHKSFKASEVLLGG